MKMLKKMAALLLVGVMALGLFTACGDEAPAKSTAEQAEDAMILALNQSMDKVGDDGKVKDGFLVVDRENKVMCMIFPADQSTALGLTAEQVAQMKDPAFTKAFVDSFRGASNLTKDDVARIKAIGVGAVTKGDKTYVAFAATIQPDH